MDLDYCSLKSKQQSSRVHECDNIDLRIHRALSWLKRAQKPNEDIDTRFLYLWIAFNAVYANDIDQNNLTERKTFTRFINRLCLLDFQHNLHHLVWDKYRHIITELLNNKFVFQPFWDYQNKQKTEEQWLQAFRSEQARITKAINDDPQTDVMLSIILSRMYTLRNQYVHGGCSFDYHTNRQQIKDCVEFLDDFVPITINILLENPEEVWGDPCYPIVPD